MSSIPKVLFTVADRSFYEPLDRYSPTCEDFHDLVAAALPPDWMIVRRNIWFHVVPQNKQLAAQGWKIHLSATQTAAEEILRRVVPILVEDRTSFKFGLDRRILSLLTGKGWHRGGSSKFITIYPDDEAHFIDLIEKIYQATAGLDGPYILSDRRYKDSRVVYYRYGGLAPIKELTAKGEQRHTLSSPDGETVDDERQPFFVLPEWVEDPFAHEEADEPDAGGENTLKDGRYLVTKALAFSNTGGVYLATDRETGDTVIVKEARPFVNTTPNGQDAVALLEKEYRLLKKIEHTGIAPRALDLFKDWEHCYMVEEFLGEVPSLRFYLANSDVHDIVLTTKITREIVEDYWSEYKRIFSRLAEMVETLHENGIVFMDLSMNNILMLDGGRELKFIDFEGAFEPEHESPSYIFTPGFVSTADMNRRDFSYASEYYSFGMLMLAYIMPINGMLGYDPQAYLRFLGEICRDFRIPRELIDIIGSTLVDDPQERKRPAQVAAELARLEIEGAPSFGACADLPDACEGVLHRTLEHFEQVMTPERSDRLFPSDPKLFLTNPLSLAYGACGVAYAIKALAGEVPQKVRDWIRSQPLDVRTYAPGLYLGLSGIAWVMWDIGLKAEARQALQAAEAHPELEAAFDVFYGVAGWGMAQLKFYLETGEASFLRQATRAGETLLRNAQEQDGLPYWPDGKEGIPLGFAHGASGISLFLLYLHLATHDERFLELGKKALELDLTSSRRNSEGALTWQLRRDTATPTSALPYLRYGSAGVGLAAVRYHWLLGDERYRDVLEEMYPDLDRKYAIFPGRFIGLAGTGELLLDLAATDGFEERGEKSLEKLITGLLLFRVDSPMGLAFPGYELFRLSADFGTGSAGIALFLRRYLYRQSADFLLDELFDDAQISARRARAAAAAGLAIAV